MTKKAEEVKTISIIVCLFCNQPGMPSSDLRKRGGLINIPLTHNNLPLTFNGKPAIVLQKAGVKCHKVCLNKVLEPAYQRRMRVRESAAIT